MALVGEDATNRRTDTTIETDASDRAVDKTDDTKQQATEADVQRAQDLDRQAREKAKQAKRCLILSKNKDELRKSHPGKQQ